MSSQKQQLTVQVVDRRLQVDLDAQENGIKNQFLQEKHQQQESDDQPNYRIDNLLPKQSQKQRLIQQNIKLKTQIYQLAKQLDQILIRDKSKKKNYGINLPKIQQEDQLIRQRRLQIQKQQIQIQQFKNKIFIAKRQLQCVYNNQAIRSKQDQIKILKGQLKILQQEKQGHLNIQKVQTKALKISKNQQEYSQKIKNITEQCFRLKKQSRQMIQKIQISQKILMKTHDTYVSKHQKIKQLQQKMVLNKQKAKIKKPNDIAITQQMISSMQNEVRQLEAKRKEKQREWQQKIKNVDISLLLKRNDEQKKMIILRQKQKQLKINELKIKELKKLARQADQMYTANQTKRSSQQTDMSQFRHKRNIRYIDK